MRDEVFAHQPPRREDMVALGRRFDALRAQRREEVAQMVHARLSPLVRDLRRSDAKADHVAVVAAMLVPEDQALALEDAVEGLAAALPDGLDVHLSGPVGPYSFVSLEMEA